MSKPVRWTERWEGLMMRAVTPLPWPKWWPSSNFPFEVVDNDAKFANIVLNRVWADTPAFHRALEREIGAEHIKRVRVTITVEEVTDGDAG